MSATSVAVASSASQREENDGVKSEGKEGLWRAGKRDSDIEGEQRRDSKAERDYREGQGDKGCTRTDERSNCEKQSASINFVLSDARLNRV